MFSFFRRGGDAFQQRRKQQEVWKQMRRLVDISAPNLQHEGMQSRSDNRQNRSLPALLVPLVDDEPLAHEAFFAVTRDCSDEGVSLLTTQKVESPQVLCVFWDDGPVILLSDVRQVRSFGADFWEVGLKLCELLPQSQFPMLNSLAARLVPGGLDEAPETADLTAGATR